jgi:predicted DNA-binding mobile mystery protein A
MAAQTNNKKLLERMAVSSLKTDGALEHSLPWEPRYGDWVRIVRNALRMSQADLARRAHISQGHLAEIETGKRDPRIGTLKKIFDAMSCDVVIEPRPRKPLDEVLRGKARSVALKRLKQSMGTMALENQAPGRDVFNALLEQKTDEILNRKSERVWREDGGRNRRHNSG